MGHQEVREVVEQAIADLGEAIHDSVIKGRAEDAMRYAEALERATTALHDVVSAEQADA